MSVRELCSVVEETEVDPSWIGDHGAKGMATLAIGAICDHRRVEVRIHHPSRSSQTILDHSHDGRRQRTDLVRVFRQETVEWRYLIVSHLRKDANDRSQPANAASAALVGECLPMALHGASDNDLREGVRRYRYFGQRADCDLLVDARLQAQPWQRP